MTTETELASEEITPVLVAETATEEVDSPEDMTLPLPAINSSPVEMIRVGNATVPLHLYLNSLNRKNRRLFLANYRKEQKESKKIQAFRADTPKVSG